MTHHPRLPISSPPTGYDLGQSCDFRVMALDWGRIAIGSALYRPGIDFSPTPWKSYQSKPSLKQTLTEIADDIREQKIEVLVFGLPDNTAQSDASAKHLKHYKSVFEKIQILLKGALSQNHEMKNLKFVAQSEHSSSQEAKERFFNNTGNKKSEKQLSKKIDSLAASIILEDYLLSFQVNDRSS